jgi:hypothetical protein
MYKCRELEAAIFERAIDELAIFETRPKENTGPKGDVDKGREREE